MDKNFLGIKKQNQQLEEEFQNIKEDKLKEELQLLKKEYQKLQMTNKQLEKLRITMEEANKMNQREKKKIKRMTCTATAAALLGAFLILPNTSAVIAHAMEQIPLVKILKNRCRHR